MSSRVLFVCFIPLKAIIRQSILSVAAVVPVPTAFQQFPIFRAGVSDPVTKKVRDWWLWDGNKEWMVGKLNAEQRAYPIRGIWNDTLFKERMNSSWTVEQDPR